jgi:hypothetical protein
MRRDPSLDSLLDLDGGQVLVIDEAGNWEWMMLYDICIRLGYRAELLRINGARFR